MTLTERQVGVVRELIRQRASIALSANKAYLVRSRLTPVAVALGFNSPGALIDALEKRPRRDWIDQVVDAMTTNETFFFRDEKPFEGLRHQVLPKLIAARRDRRTLRIWSAGCSTGQEAYSIAILLDAYFPELATWHVRIFGTDISRHAIERAREGIYSEQEVKRGLSDAFRGRYLQPHAKGYQIVDALRARVRFDLGNIAASSASLPTCDVIFMRNILVYFAPETRLKVLKRAERHLAPDGALFLGAGEAPNLRHDAFALRPVPGATHFAFPPERAASGSVHPG